MPPPTWMSEQEPSLPKITPIGFIRLMSRFVLLGFYTFSCLAVLLLLRTVERPLHGARRPWTPKITQSVCKFAFWVLGMKHEIIGTPMREEGALVANHSSWLDIFALNAFDDVYFVAKSEVAKWPLIGWLAKATGTEFIVREREKAVFNNKVIQMRLLHGHRLLFFPEGTSSDGRRILPFKPTLFEAFLVPELYEKISIQPVTLIFHAPEGQDPRFYAWWGDSNLFDHLLKALTIKQHGTVQVVYHTPVAVNDFSDRKALARHLEAQVGSALPWNS
ncbi:1-acyl-sn-glycerol-3-phosphate acyltransferase [Planktomarina sp.]|nr:1-acyl-sn-glycerol-3-phosphate acyltransferase [Planktomarina sp.]